MPSGYPGAMTEEQEWVTVGINIKMCPGQHHRVQKSSCCVNVHRDFVAVKVMVPRAKPRDLRDPKALRTEAQVQAIKKFGAGSNKKAASTAADPQKLEEAEEPVAFVRVSTVVKQAIQKARIEKKMSQAILPNKINEKTQVVREYKNGKPILAKID